MLVFNSYTCVNAVRQDEQDYDLQIKLSLYSPGEALSVQGG